MYHQFKQLADIDITQEPMEVGPTTHYMMGGVRVDADTQMSTCRACLPQARLPPACTERTGSAGNSLSDLLVFGKRAGEFAAEFAKENLRWGNQSDEVEAGVRREALEPFGPRDSVRVRGLIGFSRTCRR